MRNICYIILSLSKFGLLLTIISKTPIYESEDPSGWSRAVPHGLKDNRTDSDLLLTKALRKCIMCVFYGQ